MILALACAVAAITADSSSAEHYIGEGPARLAADGALGTFWVTQYKPTSPPLPHWVRLDLAAPCDVARVVAYPRQDGVTSGTARTYRLEILPETGSTWTNLAEGETGWSATALGASSTTVGRKVRAVRWTALSEITGGPWAALAEVELEAAPPPSSAVSMLVFGWDAVVDPRGPLDGYVLTVGGKSVTVPGHYIGRPKPGKPKVYPGELHPLHASLVRYFDWWEGAVLDACVRAKRGLHVSAECSNPVTVTWPEIKKLDGGKPSKEQRP